MRIFMYIYIIHLFIYSPSGIQTEITQVRNIHDMHRLYHLILCHEDISIYYQHLSISWTLMSNDGLSNTYRYMHPPCIHMKKALNTM